MATITGYTSARMKQIEDMSVVDGDVIDGRLVLTRNNGTTFDAGPIDINGGDLNATYVPKAGGTMTGPLTVNAALVNTGRLGLAGGFPGTRIPAIIAPTINGPDAVADTTGPPAGGTNVIPLMFQPTLTGNFANMTGTDPGFAWGMDLFAVYSGQNLTDVHGFLAELACTAPAGLSATITNKALTSNVATLTASAAHGFAVGDLIRVTGVDATFNGETYKVTAVTSTTFSYAKTAANVDSTAATGLAITGIIPLARGLQCDANLFGGTAGATIIQAESLHVNAPRRSAGAGGTIVNAYGIIVDAVTEGINSNISLYVVGGSSRFGGRVDVDSEIACSGSSGPLILSSNIGAAAAATSSLTMHRGTSGVELRLSGDATGSTRFNIYNSGGLNLLYVSGNGRLGLPNSLIRTSAQTAGTAAVLPANPAGYLAIEMNGSTVTIPYYGFA